MVKYVVEIKVFCKKLNKELEDFLIDKHGRIFHRSNDGKSYNSSVRQEVVECKDCTITEIIG